MLDERIKYWTQHWPLKNFGDFLSEYIHDRALLAPWVEADRYRLLGSAIDSFILREDLRQCGTTDVPSIALWGCGKRDTTPLDRDLLAHCRFFGVRGPLTRDALGLPADTPLGDPGFVVPLLRARPHTPAAKTLCVPHFNEPVPHDTLRARCGADAVASPAVADTPALERLLDQIASARFVLAGSLHAAIVACAYEVPFGFWDTGFIDVPFKWRDFAASIGVEMPFFESVDAAQAHYTAIAGRIHRPRASSILAHGPFAVRGSVLAAAWAREANLDAAASAALQGAAQASDPAPAWTDALRTDDAARRGRRRDRMAGGERGTVAASARYLGTLAQRLGGVVQAIEADVRAATFLFEEGGADMRFSVGSAGAALLRGGWSTPNEVGPWAVERHAAIEIPASTRWWSWRRLDLGVIAFAPKRAPLSGVRRIRVSANDCKLGEFTIANRGDGDVVFETLSMLLPDVLTRRGGDLQLVFESDVLVSAHELGIGTDTRTISFAATYLKAVPQ